MRPFVRPHTPQQRVDYERDQRGGAAIELTLITPVLLLLLLLVVAAGRLVEARMQVDDAAQNAARAASIERNATAANTAAQNTTNSTLGADGVTCRDENVTTDTTQFHAGGNVSVNVSCHVDLSDLTLLRLPGSRSIASRATSVVDEYRGIQ